MPREIESIRTTLSGIDRLKFETLRDEIGSAPFTEDVNSSTASAR